MAITQDQVNKVCKQLQEAGESQTLAAVREALGSGSMATIAKMVRTWRETQWDERHGNEPQNQTDTPNAIEEMAGKMASAIWKEAEKLADQRLAADREAMKTELASAKKELEEAYEAMEEMAQQIKNLQNVQNEAFGEFKKLQNEIDKLKAECQTAREKTATAEGRANQAETLCKMMMDGIGKMQEKPEQTATGKKKASVKAGPETEIVDTKTRPLAL